MALADILNELLRAAYEGRTPRILVIGVGAGAVVFDIERSFPSADVVPLAKEPIGLRYDVFKKVFEGSFSPILSVDEVLRSKQTNLFYTQFNEKLILHDV